MLLGGLFGNSSNAQTPVCNLRFDVFEFSGNESVKDIKAVLTDLLTKKTIEFSDPKLLLFSDITSGKYKIEIIKDGYERRIKEFELKCRTVDEVLTISKSLYLQKGDVKKVTEFGSTGYVAKGNNEEYKVQSDGLAINHNALNLAKPKYPAAALAVRATGTVNVQVTIDEDGEIVKAEAISGHPLLRYAAERAAMESRFAPTLLNWQPVQITGIIVYNFVP